MLNVVYDPFLTRKTPLFTLFILSRTSYNTTSQNIGGPRHGPSPHLKFGEDRPPSPPRSPPLARTHSHTHTRAHTHMRTVTHTYTHTHTHIYTHIHIHTYTHMQAGTHTCSKS